MPKDGPILMFAGNIGEAQGFDTMIKSALYLNELMQDVNVNWVILRRWYGKEQSIENKIS